MSKRNLSGLASLKIIIYPAPQSPGRYEARLEGDDRVLCVSGTPFFDSARALTAAGYDANSDLILRHAGSDTDCLRAKLGTAVSLTVEETAYGPKVRRWKPLPTLAVGARIARQIESPPEGPGGRTASLSGAANPLGTQAIVGDAGYTQEKANAPTYFRA